MEYVTPDLASYPPHYCISYIVISCYYIPKKDLHSLFALVTVQYFLHIAWGQVHIAWSKEVMLIRTTFVLRGEKFGSHFVFN